MTFRVAEATVICLGGRFKVAACGFVGKDIEGIRQRAGNLLEAGKLSTATVRSVYSQGVH